MYNNQIAQIASIRVNDIGEYIRYRSCERRFKLGLNDRALAKGLPFAERLFNSMDPVLQEAGRKREDEWDQYLQREGLTNLTQQITLPEGQKNLRWSNIAACFADLAPGQEAYGREVEISGNIGAFHIAGRMDFVLLLWEGKKPRLRIVECKSSRKDRTYHRVQVAVYQMLLEQILASQLLVVDGTTITANDIECVVARIDESTSDNQAILSLPALSLSTEIADVVRLLSINGQLAAIVAANLDDLNYQIESKCDDCVFSVHCLPESARTRRLHLLGIEPSIIRSLNGVGIKTIDDLANLDLTGSIASSIRENHGFTENLELLKTKAKARRRTLPGGDANSDDYEVDYLRHVGESQLPTYNINGEKLIRVYLCIEYDYVENRIGALAAHITKSNASLHTGFIQANGQWQLNPVVQERLQIGVDSNNSSVYEETPLQSREVIQFKRSPWTGNYVEDTSAEKELIQTFLMELVDMIADVAEVPEAPIHFYVWSRSEMSNLVKGCSRAASYLLSHLRELLGCRESLDQLIYSCLQEEVDRRFALGWTGRGLAVVSSLRWFGRRYHWRRRISGQEVNLDHEFAQDIFDFKTDLDLVAADTWAESNKRGYYHKFEIRSRFNDSLPAPYWRAYWRTLPEPDTMPAGSLRSAIQRYNNARKPKYLQEYLRARTYALRWVEEGITKKNSEISKPFLSIADLPDFSLNVDDTAQAAIDFLRLDQHVKTANWISDHLIPPIYRVSKGDTVPVSNVVPVKVNGQDMLRAVIDLASFDTKYEVFKANCSFSEGAFIRLSPCSSDPHRGQTIKQFFYGGFTCILEALDWNTNEIYLSVITFPEPDRYRLYSKSYPREQDIIFTHATIDDSPSDFVAPRVDARLRQGKGTHAFRWFHPQEPQIPPQRTLASTSIKQYRTLLESLLLPNGCNLDKYQIQAVLDGLSTRVQLLQGPPGTGKTATTAAAALLRILARRAVHQVGQQLVGDIVLIAANTHTAVDNLLRRIDALLPELEAAVVNLDLSMTPVKLAKVHSSPQDVQQKPVGGSVVDFSADSCANQVKKLRKQAVLVIGGTTASILKMVNALNKTAVFQNEPQGFQVPLLIVDEASMLVFPHFLALASLVTPDGEIMLAGDHRQLAPIVAHDWEREERPPVVLYQPYASAYEAVLNIKQNVELDDIQLSRSPLSFTFRLPPPIRELLSRLYERDNITLQGPAGTAGSEPTATIQSPWSNLWQNTIGLYLVLHSECQSKRINQAEVRIIEEILVAGNDIPASSVAIITPHRAQRSLLKQSLPDYYENSVDVIDTVERLQGDERPTVIVSATASDLGAISKNVEFILDLNRSNVAFSRAQNRLIVVCSRTLLDYVPAEYEYYESAMLWKSLRELCSEEVATTSVEGYEVKVYTIPSTLHLSIHRAKLPE